MFFEELQAGEGNFKTLATALPGRTPAQCEELFNLHRPLLSTPAATAEELLAAMQEHYSHNQAEYSDTSQQTSGQEENPRRRGGERRQVVARKMFGAEDEQERDTKTASSAAARRNTAAAAAAKPTTSGSTQSTAEYRVNGAAAAEKPAATVVARAVGKRTPRAKPGVDASLARAAHALTFLPGSADQDDASARLLSLLTLGTHPHTLSSLCNLPRLSLLT